MEIDPNIINIEKFNQLTKNKWINESLEFFKCNQCSLIVVGVPDSHIALFDSSDLTKKIQYNLPRKIKCPSCKAIWYDLRMNGYEIEDISIDKFLSSNWKLIFNNKNL